MTHGTAASGTRVMAITIMTNDGTASGGRHGSNISNLIVADAGPMPPARSRSLGHKLGGNGISALTMLAPARARKTKRAVAARASPSARGPANTARLRDRGSQDFQPLGPMRPGTGLAYTLATASTGAGQVTASVRTERRGAQAATASGRAVGAVVGFTLIDINGRAGLHRSSMAPFKVEITRGQILSGNSADGAAHAAGDIWTTIFIFVICSAVKSCDCVRCNVVNTMADDVGEPVVKEKTAR